MNVGCGCVERPSRHLSWEEFPQGTAPKEFRVSVKSAMIKKKIGFPDNGVPWLEVKPVFDISSR